jgi:16S rRNA (guanine966-N2)-methyltransferase
VREALFSSLDARGLVDDAAVLDLYAGTGALGLEAASRGATDVVLVDRAAPAAAACKENARAVKQRVRGNLALDVHAQSALGYLRATSRVFDLVFMDPPYEVDEDEVVAVLEALVPRLSPDAVVLVERSTRSPEPAWPDGIEPFSKRSYGDTMVWEARPGT